MCGRDKGPKEVEQEKSIYLTRTFVEEEEEEEEEEERVCDGV